MEPWKRFQQCMRFTIAPRSITMGWCGVCTRHVYGVCSIYIILFMTSVYTHYLLLKYQQLGKDKLILQEHSGVWTVIDGGVANIS